jgi:hypothetical protein
MQILHELCDSVSLYTCSTLSTDTLLMGGSQK